MKRKTFSHSIKLYTTGFGRKTLLILTAFVLALSMLQAQVESIDNLKPGDGEIGLGIKAQGLKGIIWENSFDSLSLQFRKVKDASTILRANVNISFISGKSSEKDVFSNGGYSLEESAVNQFLIGIAPGIEKHFQGTKRLDPYVGASLSLTYIGKTNSSSKDDIVYSDGSYSKTEAKQTAPGGFGLGLDGFAGMNFFVANRISIGLEYSLGLNRVGIKGKFSFKSTHRVKPTSSASETVTTIESDGDERELRTTYFGNKGVVGLNLIFYLGQ